MKFPIRPGKPVNDLTRSIFHKRALILVLLSRDSSQLPKTKCTLGQWTTEREWGGVHGYGKKIEPNLSV